MKVITTDGIGIISGSLCLIHCVATPFIFIAKACSVSCCSDAPLWWQSIDYLFLIISFIAISFVSKNTNNNLLKISFWLSWVILLVVILNQSFELFYLPKNLIYISSFLIISLHLYNIKYNSCKNDCK